jgi:hypothetical protein
MTGVGQMSDEKEYPVFPEQWRAEEKIKISRQLIGDDVIPIINPSYGTVCLVQCADLTEYPNDTDGESHAEQIVRAVNCHDELVAALKETLITCGKAVNHLHYACGICGDPNRAPDIRDTIDEAMATGEKIRAALAKAANKV